MRKSLDRREDGPRVRVVQLEDFRGVVGRVEVTLERAGQPCSALIFGENGSGKSSLVDAVEWACQGRIGRAPAGRSALRATPINASSKSGSGRVRVDLDDGNVLTRTASVRADTGEFVTKGTDMPAYFARVPMSLKRADITNFLETPPASRGKLFIDHNLTSANADSMPNLSAQEQEVRDRTLAAKTAVREAARKVSEHLKVEAPTTSGAINAMVNDQVYKGLSARLRKLTQLPRELSDLMQELQAAQTELESVTTLARNSARLQASPMANRLKSLHEILGDVNDWLTHAFHAVTGAKHVERLEVLFGAASEISIDVWVHLTTGQRMSPQQVFSEGYQDLVALLYFFAIQRAAGLHGQAKVLILDDVLQSVDAEIRLALMNLVVEEFGDWQLLVTVHDRLWRQQLRDIFQRSGHRVVDVEIRNWQFLTGPAITNSGGDDPAAAVWRALELQDPFMVCGSAGRALEQACDRLSWTIPISVKRRRGDAYTLGDLWPGVLKELKGTSASAAAAEVDRYLHLRNAAGAHYNEWAESLPWRDAEAFGFAVLEFLSTAHCSACNQWVGRGSDKEHRCRCGGASIFRLK